MEDVFIPDDHQDVELRGRPFTKADTGRMLGAGWLLYLGSLILNLVFYQMHPSSPEMGTWGKAETIEEWTLLVEKETQNEEGEWKYNVCCALIGFLCRNSLRVYEKFLRREKFPEHFNFK